MRRNYTQTRLQFHGNALCISRKRVIYFTETRYILHGDTLYIPRKCVIYFTQTRYIFHGNALYISEVFIAGRSCEELDCPFYANCVMDQRVARCRCPSNCPLTPRKVCGDNQQTYLNKCVLKSESCRLNKLINITRKGPCGE